MKIILSLIRFLLTIVVTVAVAGAIIYFNWGTLMKNPQFASLVSNPSVRDMVANVVPKDALKVVGAGGGLSDGNTYKTENNFIAAKTVRELAGMAWIIVHPNLPVPQFGVTADVDPHKNHVHLVLTGWSEQPVTSDFDAAFAWDSKAYAQLAHQLIGDVKPGEPADASLDLNPADLLTPKGEVLAKKDVELSRALQSHPSSATLHERAALLLITLALRENAAELTDGRIAMSRACAHLALARALNGGTDPVTDSGKLAIAGLSALSGREVEAMQQITAMISQPNAPVELTEWAQALLLIAKDDYRAVNPEEGSPLLVKIAWFKVMLHNLDGTLACARLDKLGKLDAVPDWGRAIWSGGLPSVDIGHRFCAATIALEQQELKSILSMEGASVNGQSPLSDVFKNPVGNTVSADTGQNTIHVVGLDLFEDISERHYIAGVWEMNRWMAISQKTPDEAAKFMGQMDTLFAGTRRENWLTNFLERDPKGMADVGPVQGDLSEMPPAFAGAFKWTETSGSDLGKLKHFYAWPFPFGTVFEATTRGMLTYNAVRWQVDPDCPTFTEMSGIGLGYYPFYYWKAIYGEEHPFPPAQDPVERLRDFFDYNSYSIDLYRDEMKRANKMTPAIEADLQGKMAALGADHHP